MTSPRERHEHATRLIRGGVYRIAEAAGATFTEVPFYPGALTTELRPDPRAATTAAIALYYAAGHRIRDLISDSRAAGTTWTQIADDLGFVNRSVNAVEDPERAAWRLAAEGLLPGQDKEHESGWRTYDPLLSWTCNSCGKLVLEHDLEDGLNAQRGHADNCARYAAEWAARDALSDTD